MLTVGVICQVLRSGFRSTKAAGKGYTFRFFRSLCNVNMTACYEKCLWMCQWSPEDTGTWKIRSQLKIPRRGRAFAAVAGCGHSDCEKLLGHLVGEFSSLGQSKAGEREGNYTTRELPSSLKFGSNSDKTANFAWQIKRIMLKNEPLT